MKRTDLINRLRVAGYHDDQAALVRLYTENRIRYDKAIRTFDEGKRLRRSGVRCDCYECRREAHAPPQGYGILGAAAWERGES